MKKLIVIAIAALSFSAASAQYRDDNHNWQDRNQQSNQQKGDWYNKDQHQSNDYAYGRNNDRNRQAEFDRMNNQYDQRINNYRNDRSLTRFERDGKIRECEQERQQQTKGLGKGLIVGGVAAILLGAILSH